MHSVDDFPNLQVVSLDEVREEISMGPESPVLETSIYLNVLDRAGNRPIKPGLSDKLISTRLERANRESGRAPLNLCPERFLLLY